MKLTNAEMNAYLYSLEQIAPKTQGKLAYAIAKNIRKLANELVEYNDIKDKALVKYGTADENGIYSIKIDGASETFRRFVEEMQPYDNDISDVSITMVNPDDVYNAGLNGTETMQILFMIKDEEDTDNGAE